MQSDVPRKSQGPGSTARGQGWKSEVLKATGIVDSSWGAAPVSLEQRQ